MNNIFKVYLFILRETQTAQVGEGHRGRERESQAGSVLPAQRLTQGSNSWNHEIMTWSKTKSQTLNWLSHSDAPSASLEFTSYGSLMLLLIVISRLCSCCSFCTWAILLFCISFIFFLFKVISTPDLGLELTTSKSRVACSDWASAVSLLFCNFNHWQMV